MSQLLEVNEYAYVQALGVLSLTQIGTVEIVPSNVVKIHWETQVTVGPGTQNRFRVYMVGGRTFITNWGGTSSIENWTAPFTEVAAVPA